MLFGKKSLSYLNEAVKLECVQSLGNGSLPNDGIALFVT